MLNKTSSRYDTERHQNSGSKFKQNLLSQTLSYFYKSSSLKSSVKNLKWTSLCSITFFSPMMAWGIDVDSADFMPAPEGTTMGLLYAQYAKRDRLYQDGKQVLDDPSLNSTIGIARLVHYMKFNEITVAPQFLLPFGKLDAGEDTVALGKKSGIGDIIVATPFWLINDVNSRSYLVFAPYLALPTGKYDHEDPLNLGENRWKFTFQVGAVKGFSEKWYVDLTGDVTFYGKNDDYGATNSMMEQDPLYQGQIYLRHQFSPTANGFVGLSQTFGGETKVNGISNNDDPRQTKISIGGSSFISPKTQILVTIARDLKVENGFMENARINMRLLHIF